MQRQYYSWVGVILLSPLLHGSLSLYKRVKNKADRDYAASLRQQTVTGARNPFKPALLLVSLAIFITFLYFHSQQSKKLDQVISYQ